MILVVDDDHTMTELLSELLSAEGYEVRVAHNGTDAFKHVRDPRCKGLLLDMHMPGINGPELLLLLEAEGIRRPTLIMTSDPDFDEAEMKQFANVRRLFHKPLYPEDVLDAVRHYCEPPDRLGAKR